MYAESLKDAMPGTSNESIDPIELAILVLREKKIILQFMLVAAGLTAIIVFFIMKPVYTGEAMFLPPQTAPGSAMSQIAGQLGSLGSIGGMLGGLKSPSDVYLGVLESRTIADSLVQEFDLQKVYKTKRLSDAVKQLRKNSTFVAGKNTLITISVQDYDPKRATDLANAYIEALRVQNGHLALSESSQRRLFFEQQLEREKNALADAEVELRKTQEKTGLIAPAGQAQVEIQTTAEIRAQITSRQVQLGALQQGATDQNPQVVRLKTEIASLQQQLQKLQNDPSLQQPGNVQLPTAKVPAYALEFIRKQRDVKYHEILFELIARQYEAARLDESRDSPVLQIVDRATIPDKKTGPHRALLVLAAAILGFLVGVCYVLFRRFIWQMKRDPEKAIQLQTLKDAAW